MPPARKVRICGCAGGMGLAGAPLRCVCGQRVPCLAPVVCAPAVMGLAEDKGARPMPAGAQAVAAAGGKSSGRRAPLYLRGRLDAIAFTLGCAVRSVWLRRGEYLRPAFTAHRISSEKKRLWNVFDFIKKSVWPCFRNPERGFGRGCVRGAGCWRAPARVVLSGALAARAGCWAPARAGASRGGPAWPWGGLGGRACSRPCPVRRPCPWRSCCPGVAGRARVPSALRRCASLRCCPRPCCACVGF